MKTKRTLEVELQDGGSFKVFVNGLHLANLVRISPRPAELIPEMWWIRSLTCARKNGRNRYETPEAAIKAYYGRKATVKS